MRPAHLEAFRPLCPRCRRATGEAHPLSLTRVEGEDGSHILWGILGCAACGMEYPIVDGVPVLIPDLRDGIARALPLMLMRGDVPAAVESLIGDAAGPGSLLDTARQNLSSYAWDHYGDLDPAPDARADSDYAEPGAVLRSLETGLALLPGDLPPGPAVDLGCGPGRTTFALAARTGGLVLGLDLHYPFVQFATRVARSGEVAYARRRIGLVYDRRAYPAVLPGAERVDFWMADATALPLADAGVALATGFNLIDCLGAPREGLAAIGRLLADGGAAILSTPYDWSAANTPVENWLGGHSQRGPHGGAGEPVLRMLMNEESGLELAAEAAEVPWHLRLHARSVMRYSCHLVVARRRRRRS